MRNVASNGLPSLVVPETRWTLREYAILPSELITRSFTSALIGPLNMSRKPCQGFDVPARRHDIVGEHVIGVAAHDLLSVFRLDAVDEPLFKRLDFRGIAGPGRHANRAGSDHHRDADCRSDNQGSFHRRHFPRLARHVHDRLQSTW